MAQLSVVLWINLHFTGWVWRCWRVRGNADDPDSRDAIALHMSHGKLAIFEFDGFANCRNMSQAEQQISGESLEAGIDGEFYAVNRGKIRIVVAPSSSTRSVSGAGARGVSPGTSNSSVISPTICSMTSSTVTSRPPFRTHPR